MKLNDLEVTDSVDMKWLSLFHLRLWFAFNVDPNIRTNLGVRSSQTYKTDDFPKD